MRRAPDEWELDMDGLPLVMFEVWQNDDKMIGSFWLMDDSAANALAERIAYGLGGMAHRELSGIVRPD